MDGKDNRKKEIDIVIISGAKRSGGLFLFMSMWYDAPIESLAAIKTGCIIIFS